MTIETRFHARDDDRILIGASPITGSVFISAKRDEAGCALFMPADRARVIIAQLTDAIAEVDAYAAPQGGKTAEAA